MFTNSIAPENLEAAEKWWAENTDPEGNVNIAQCQEFMIKFWINDIAKRVH